MENVRTLLKKASEEERQALAKILKAKHNPVAEIFDGDSDQIDNIIRELRWNAQHKSDFIFEWILSDNKVSYKEVVQKNLKYLKVEFLPFESVRELEIKLAQHVFKTVWDKMTDQQKEEMEEQLQREATKFDKAGALKASGGLATAMIAGNVSGFGIYLLASTSLGAITGLLGVTLPFAVYMGMSSAISVILGPVGWAGLGLFTIWKVADPNYQRLTQAILYICALREKVEGGYE